MTFRMLLGIDEIPREEWDRVVGADAPPVLRWDWIDALERSGSASKRTGWEPAHLTVWRGKTLAGVAPAWRKFHSMGEYVYDFSWANAAAQMGIEYYPKLLIGVPLSPITARRFHAAAGEDPVEVREALLEGAIAAARERDMSSVHVIFPPEDEAAALESRGLARRVGMQYHWKNRGYGSYDDYLARFSSKRRNQLKRERGAAAAQGIEIRTVRGSELSATQADLAFKFYDATVRKNGWGHAQLNRDFFRRAFAALPDAVELVEATRDGKVIAGAFNLASKDHLWGRYWGCFEEVPFLHFNVCLYHSVDECIRMGRQVFEPGAGGEHKIARGFEPTAIHSAHVVFDRRLDRAVRDFVDRERRALADVLERSEEIAGLKPLRSPGSRGNVESPGEPGPAR